MLAARATLPRAAMVSPIGALEDPAAAPNPLGKPVVYSQVFNRMKSRASPPGTATRKGRKIWTKGKAPDVDQISEVPPNRSNKVSSVEMCRAN